MLTAVKTAKGYLLARDTRLNIDDVPNDLSLQDNDLIFPTFDDPDTYIGVQGDCRTGYFLRYLEGMLPAKGKSLTMKYMVTTFVPRLYEKLIEARYADEDEVPHFDCSIIVIRKNKGFLVLKDGSVQEIGDEECTGDGSNFADGILTYNNHKAPLKRIMETYSFVSKHCFLVSTNIIVGDTSKPDGFIIYDSNDMESILNGGNQA